MKKILSLVLALLMIVSCASMVFATDEVEDTAIAEEEVEVTAEAPAGPYDEALEFLHYYGIWKGNGESLAAEEPILRYQMALLTSRLATGWLDDANWYSEETNYSVSAFTDLEGTYAAQVPGALTYAQQKGIIQGYGDGRFGPMDGIRYEDALTMVVRLLGYDGGLKWPWGYIETAVNLGLTAGIEGVAYSDELLRGEVAQILYNALFTKCSDGSTLALKVFGFEFGWKTVIITATNVAALTSDDKVVKEADLVAFRTVKDDGTLNATTYKTSVKSLGLDADKHDDEKALGAAYRVLFEIDGDLAKVVKYKDLFVKQYWNYAGTTEVKDFLGTVTLKDKFYTTNVLGDTYGQFIAKQFILLDKSAQKVAVYDNVLKYAIDFQTGDILVLNEDGKGAISLTTYDASSKTPYLNYTYDIAWHYDWYTESWYKYVYKNAGTEYEELIGVQFIDEATWKDVYTNKYTQIKNGEVEVFYLNTTSPLKTTAYCSLDTYQLKNDGVENYGLFSAYRLGQYTEGKGKDGDKADQPKVIVKNLDAVATAKVNKDVTAPAPSVDAFTEESTGSSAVKLWINNLTDYELSKGDYIISNYDKKTGELTIVKNITKQNDADNFVATGIVRAYSASAGKVTIGETTYTFDYENLLGVGILKSDKKAPLANNTALLKSLFNQFVTYVVCDGKLVYIERTGATGELIVIDSYAGIDNDGYINVWGYKTDELKYTNFRIGSYNSWLKGDYFFYSVLPNGQVSAEVVEALSRGSIYRISSYDAEEDVYYVQVVSRLTMRTPFGQATTTDPYYFAYDIDNPTTIKFDEDLYKSVNGGSYKKSSKDDKYIFVLNENVFGWAPIVTYTGQPHDVTIPGANGGTTVLKAENWTVTGDLIEGPAATVLVNVTNIVGFNYDKSVSYCVFWGYDYDTASYDGYDGSDWYLLGASTYTAKMFNLYTGKEDYAVVATNKNLKKGYAYPVIDGVVVSDEPITTEWLDTAVPASYASSAKYTYGDAIIGFDEVTGDPIYAELDPAWVAKAEFSKWYAVNVKGKDASKASRYTDLFNGITIFEVEDDYKYDTNGYLISGTGKFTLIKEWKSKTELSTYIGDNKNVYFWYIVDAEGNVVLYFTMRYAEIPAVDPAPKTETYTTDNWIPVPGATGNGDIAYINAKGTFLVDRDADGDIVSAKLTGVTFFWDGKLIDKDGDGEEDEVHNIIWQQWWHFGYKGECFEEEWYTKVDGTRVIGSIADSIYENHDEWEDWDCDMVNSVSVTFEKKELTKDSWTSVDVTFNANDQVNTFRLLAKIADNKIVFSFYADGPATVHGVSCTPVVK